MGIYFNTYLCNGKFTDKNTVEILEKVVLNSMDEMIEPHEWEKEVVSKEELLPYCTSRNIQLEYSEDNDLFMMQAMYATLDNDHSEGPGEFILVERNCQFKK